MSVSVDALLDTYELSLRSSELILTTEITLQNEFVKVPFRQQRRAIDVGHNYAKAGEKASIMRRMDRYAHDLKDEYLQKFAKDTYVCSQDRRMVVSICQACGQVHVHPIHCNHRFFCPQCTRKYTIRNKAKYGSIMALAEKTPLAFLTVTIKNPTHISKALLKRLKDSFYKLRRPIDSPIHSGGIAKMECPLGRAGDWNLHIHCIYSCESGSPAADKKDIVRRWRKLTAKYLGQESYIIHIRNADRKSLLETLKYTMSPESSRQVVERPALLCEFLKAFRGVRVLWTWGTFQGIRLENSFVCVRCKGQCEFMGMKNSFYYMIGRPDPRPPP